MTKPVRHPKFLFRTMSINKKILILGGSGLVGSHFVKYIQDLKANVRVPTSVQLNVLVFDVLRQYINYEKPDIVINFVAYTNRDKAEKEKGDREGLVWKTNVELVDKLVGICQEFNIYLIHISTDAVFSGSERMKGPYSENQALDVSENLNWYGETKRQSEIVIREANIKCAIIRINYPFGNAKSEKDFARKIYHYILCGYPLFVDQQFNPTYLPDLDIAIQRIIQTEAQGIFHVASKEIVTPFDFGQLIRKFTGLKIQINKGSRVIFGGLNIAQTEQKLELEFHTIKNALKEFCREIS